MKAIVTGGAGFIGSRLVQALHSIHVRVLIIDDFSTHDKGLVDWPRLPEGSRMIAANVTDVRIPRDFWDSDVVFHLASKVGPVGVLRHKGHIAKDTIDTASRAADWAVASACPLVYVSTSEVYGSPDAANTEDTPKVFRKFTARSEYAVSKLAAENMLVNRDGVDVRIARPFNVTGPGQRTDGGFVIPRFVESALKNEYLTVYSPGTQRRSFTHVDDIVGGLLLVWTEGVSGETYNLGNPNNTRTILELAKMVMVETGRGAITIVNPVDIWGPDFYEAPEKLPNVDKAIEELGFHPEIPIETIVKESVEYARTGIRLSDTQ